MANRREDLLDVPPMSGPKLVIVGDSLFAEIAYEYFTHDSPYERRGVRGRARVPQA